MRAELNLSAIDAALGLAVYAWGFAFAPLILAPFSEECEHMFRVLGSNIKEPNLVLGGRNALYLGSAFVFMIFFIPVALAQVRSIPFP